MAEEAEGQAGPAAHLGAHRPPGPRQPRRREAGQGVSELRLTYGPGYRVYYLQEADRLILLLCGGDKSTQHKDIDKAHRLADEWREEEDSDDTQE